MVQIAKAAWFFSPIRWLFLCKYVRFLFLPLNSLHFLGQILQLIIDVFFSLGSGRLFQSLISHALALQVVFAILLLNVSFSFFVTFVRNIGYWFCWLSYIFLLYLYYIIKLLFFLFNLLSSTLSTMYVIALAPVCSAFCCFLYVLFCL